MGQFILGMLLTFGPQTLYSLNKQFQAGASQFYSASFGGLQSALRGLVAAGHVGVTEVTENGRLKKVHTITEDGVVAFHAWVRGQIEGDVELAALSRIFHLGLVEDAADRASILTGMADAAQHRLEELEGLAAHLEAARDGLPAEAKRVFHYQVATLDYGIMAHRAGVAWLRARAAAEG
ncbi:helix-turn-helix transcriptional regulator [Propioniciclava sp. MC1683]|uniref:helix-turn-helix transcriptional regulator n=1 Tax=Propioniciclava sp. MC1683 TaxID=2760309 RepID=UPI0016021819|nr:helix-turn-helix transcriptional regulator [Propioniciclava sp. MC1683]MBB1502655.1 helix-turn-helix transcriptional regulator [Propioniciclava sp. MC1683]